MTVFPRDPVISAQWLGKRHDLTGFRILDARYYLPNDPRDGRKEYEKGHIKNALHFDIDAIVDPDQTLPHMLPNEKVFEEKVEKFGIGADTPVIVYDDGSLMGAPRVWWMFRIFGHDEIRVLDGGLRAWIEAGLPVTDEAPASDSPPVRHEQAFRARYNRALYRDLEQIRSHIRIGDAQIVDARPAGRFSGEAPEPRPGIQPGHMKGSYNFPFTELVGADGLLLDADTLRARLASIGVDPQAPIVTSCGSGVTAPSLSLALARLGCPDAPVYDGSWSEWASTGQEIVTGEAET